MQTKHTAYMYLIACMHAVHTDIYACKHARVDTCIQFRTDHGYMTCRSCVHVHDAHIQSYMDVRIHFANTLQRMHTRMHAYIHTYVRTRSVACENTYIPRQRHTRKNIHTEVHTHTCVLTNHACIRAYIQKHIHTSK